MHTKHTILQVCHLRLVPAGTIRCLSASCWSHISCDTSCLSCVQVDLLPSEEAIHAVEDAIHAHNAGVTIIRTSHCSLNIAQILNRNAFVGSSQPPSLQMLPDNMPLGPSHMPHDIQPAATGNESDMQQIAAASVGHNAKPFGSHRSSEGADSDHQAANQQHSGDQGQSASSSNGSHGHSHQHPMSHDHAGHAHQHDSSVRSISITCPGEVDMIRSVSSASVMYLCIVRVDCCRPLATSPRATWGWDAGMRIANLTGMMPA